MQTRADHKEALGLRLRGKSYGEIRQILGIPKSTQSGWFKDLKLSPGASRILETKKGNGLQALSLFNRSRSLSIQHENETISKEYELLVGKLTEHELMLIGASLYWAEGYNNFGVTKRNRYPYVGFVNTDPKLIKVFIGFLEKTLKIGKNNIRGEIHLHPGLSKDRAIKFWKKETYISENNLRVYIAISRASQKRRPQNLLPYGTLQLKVRDRREFFKIQGLIKGIAKAIMGS